MKHQSLRVFFLAFLVCTSVLLQGCGEDVPVVKVDFSKRESVKVPVPEPAITYAYLPQYSHEVSYARHNPLIQYLTKETGLPMRQVFPDTFAEHVRMVQSGEIDISFSNPVVYVQLAQMGSTAFARIKEPDGRPTFRGQIIVHAQNKAIQTLKDVIGKRWMAVDPHSAGGYLYALGYFLDHGIHAHDFSEIAFAPGPGGKQEKAALAVYAGKCDVASVREGALDTVKDKINLQDIRVLAVTPEYPGWVYSARRGMDKEIVSKIAKAMFKLSMDTPTEAAILTNARTSGIIPATDSDYDAVRTLIQKVEADKITSTFPSIPLLPAQRVTHAK
ncbi:phosphate/phosphite/phosphonate ABC transporter substrate-binding protein [Halodesulfovibrio aestuarii]|uniref:Phosphate/phosphite/phosphonate ABC transporter substrate-binding protein n=1 Tax=Halodesulfovibrio aestuarii TaxID=126333 RepID=A0ABV4JW04_9BACT